MSLWDTFFKNKSKQEEQPEKVEQKEVEVGEELQTQELDMQKYLGDDEKLKANILQVSKGYKTDVEELTKAVIFMHTKYNYPQGIFYYVKGNIEYYLTEYENDKSSPVHAHYCLSLIRYCELTEVLNYDNCILLKDMLDEFKPLTSEYIPQ